MQAPNGISVADVLVNIQRIRRNVVEIKGFSRLVVVVYDNENEQPYCIFTRKGGGSPGYGSYPRHNCLSMKTAVAWKRLSLWVECTACALGPLKYI